MLFEFDSLSEQKAKIKVIGVDDDNNKINSLKKGNSYIKSSRLKKFKYFNHLR